MPELELTAGTIDYEDTGGEGPVLVLLAGVLMDGSVWDPVVADLQWKPWKSPPSISR